VASKLKGASDFDKAAKAAGFEAKTTEFLNRDAAVPDVGASPDLLEAAFKLPQGGVSDPVATETGVAIVKVVEKENVSAQDYTARKDAFRDEYLNDQKNRFFSNYMMKAKQGMKIEVSPEAVQRAVE
jgi:parvulin-like peptidyl-prolyl isomerase